MGRVIGIDLGTTNSVVAYMERNQFVIIPNSRGNRVTPSIVAFTKKGEILVGEAAKNQAVINSDRTVIGIKRKMGSNETIVIDGKEYMPQVISGFLLRKLKEDSEKYFGEKVTDAVITVPAYFSDAQRQATVDAGKIAGLNVLRIINEPTAAALAYGLNVAESQRILVYDLGGGTFDVSILELDDGVFEVIATRGNNKLGGMDFDNALKDVIVKQFLETSGIDLSQDKFALQKLIEEVEKAKIALSDENSTEINIPFITADETGPKHLQFEITRREFEILIEDYINQTIELMDMAVKDAGISVKDIDKVILVGGSTRIPLVVKKIEEYTGKKAFRGINPDEVVAAGAAIQTSIIKGDISGVVLADVTPLSLGIEVEGDGFVPIIKRNTPIPTRETKIFTTTVPNQEEVEIHVLQGERKLASQNISLGKFILSSIRRADAGIPRIEVSFDIDVNSIVHVSAKDLDTGNAQEVVINSRVSFSKEEIDLLIKEADRYKKRDEELLHLSNIKNEIKILINKLNKTKDEKAIDEKMLEEIENLIETSEKAINYDDIDRLEKTILSIKTFLDEIITFDKYETNSIIGSKV